MAHDPVPAPPRVVYVVDRRFSSVLSCPDSVSERLVRRTATAAGCEQDPSGTGWIVYGTRIERVIAMMERAGYVVERTTISTSDATSARTS